MTATTGPQRSSPSTSWTRASWARTKRDGTAVREHCGPQDVPHTLAEMPRQDSQVTPRCSATGSRHCGRKKERVSFKG
jgi:hypothetical protein